MEGFAGLRARLRLRQRLRGPIAVKHDAEVRWWLEKWDPVLRAGGFNPGDASALLDGEEPALDYLGRRWQQARAEVRRVLLEAEMEDEGFFEGKVVLDVGPGPLGFPDACPARVSIGVDPLAERYRQHGLLLPGSPAVYLACGAESIPLVSGAIDVVVARNSLDHVDDPEAAIGEAQRLLRPGGTLILNFDVDHAPTPTEPHDLTADRVRAALSGFEITKERVLDHPSGAEGHGVVIVAKRRSS